MCRLSVTNLAKRFGPRKVFSDISFQLETGDSLAVVGPNGSGKTTLLMTILNGYHPTRGEVTFYRGGRRLAESQVRTSSSLVAPYLNFYDDLTAEENLKFFASVTGRNVTGKEINSLLARVGLEGRGMDLIRAYSSGMKQRLKYAVALLGRPEFLFLDEPTSSLDEHGKRIVFDMIEEYRKNGILVIATNEREEYSLASNLCRLDQ